MPYRRSKKHLKKRFNKRKTYRKSKNTNMTRQVGFPTNRIVKMRYSETLQLDLVSGVIQYVFSANNLQDPNTTGTGHQPLGYDQWQTWYNHYAVLGSKIRYYITPYDNVSASRATTVACYISDDPTATSDVQTLIEQGRGSFGIHGALSDAPIKIGTKFSAKKFFNIKDVKDNMTRIGATFGAAPAEQASYILNMETSSTTSDTYNILVVIDYIVMLSEPKELPSS